MANSIQAFFQTLKAAEGDFNQAKIGQVALLDGVHMDVKSEAATVGQTINVPFPDVGPMSPVNNGILTTSPVNPNYAPMVFNTRVGKALQFQDFERWQTSEDLAREFLLQWGHGDGAVEWGPLSSPFKDNDLKGLPREVHGWGARI